MDFDQITTLIAPPIDPIETSGSSWTEIEREIGAFLPADYKKFVSTYGTGSIGDFLWVFNPFSKNKNLNLNSFRYLQSSYQNLKADFPELYDRPPFPLHDSFFTWAQTDNGDSLIWIIKSEPPETWQVGIHSADQAEEELTSLTFTGFMVRLLEKQLASRILPKQFLQAGKNFLPSA
ncbi:SMI1-KNR4 cell-wall [Rhizobium sp. RU33A]|uniref:SMI1/KNR4 family protein n=1 Tax=Rhizobium sp. RU33A TaxID=1907413 RepID=UPI00095453BC|nr:SMI1/KNR4 family protein [Rhizobium sp. RU33A]SIR15916.1 SMI1-KNR4 cell-wall [Rhizobium sp. RU33A]